MAGAATKQKQSKRTEMTIALIGLAGVLITGTLSNWDKLFPKENLVQATYSGYRPTGNFETELRYFFDVSGTRQTVESMQRQLLSKAKEDLLSKNPDSAKEIQNTFDVIEKESIGVDDVIRVLLPLYQKHFTIAEIQELNKFYSTEVMQNMTKKMPLLAQDAAPIQIEMLNDYLRRVETRLQQEHSQ